MSKNHYVYYSYEEWGRGYIGVRSTKLNPQEDTYMGSFRDETFKPTQKIILEEFKSRKEAMEAEILLHDFYEVGVNPHFANRAKQTSTLFDVEGVFVGNKNYMHGKTHSAEARRKISEHAKSRVGKKAAMYGKTHSAGARKKISEFRKTRVGDKNPMYGRRGENSPIFGIVRDEQTRKKMSDHAKKCKWWNDGVSIKRCPECPGPGWILGMKIKREV